MCNFGSKTTYFEHRIASPSHSNCNLWLVCVAIIPYMFHYDMSVNFLLVDGLSKSEFEIQHNRPSKLTKNVLFVQ